MSTVAASTGLTITNPLVQYRALLATKQIRPDPAQHRLALQLQKLYYRLKDYDPEIEYRQRLDEITRSIDHSNKVTSRNGLQQRPRSPLPLSSLWSGAKFDSSLSLTETIPIQDSALKIKSPLGMLLYGEVGRGKSMLLDLLADALPSRKKRRWHFSTFMLDTFRRLERLRIQRVALPAHLQNIEQEHSVLMLARETISDSPILFLDEFQMPDRAASKLLNNFMTSFFHLGGVLIATSNRMPEELAKASGVEFTPPPTNIDSLFGWRRKQPPGQMAAAGDFAMFLDVLRARCEIWEMEGEKDWRRDGEVVDDAAQENQDIEDLEVAAAVPAVPQTAVVTTTEKRSSDLPDHYHLYLPTDRATAEEQWNIEVSRLTALKEDWSPSSITVYGRTILVPAATAPGITKWSFAQLCATNLGPADYTTLASTYHTLILTEVPILTLVQKNEARRFITLLDALYECRCRLLIRAAAPPDRLFFPEMKRAAANCLSAPDGDSNDEVYKETLSEIYQDSTSPFRPNVSVYTDSKPLATYVDPSFTSEQRSVLADEDADFGPTYGNGRGHGAATDAVTRSEYHGRNAQNIGPDFTNTSLLTGEDERFAYKRARSRLWEMCGNRWWSKRAGKDPAEWWRPLRTSERHWETGSTPKMTGAVPESHLNIGQQQTAEYAGLRPGKEQSVFRHGASPFRTRADAPPKFGWQHAWGMMTWGRKAGDWGQGVEGERAKTKADKSAKVQEGQS